jgi:hypothetical protein
MKYAPHSKNPAKLPPTPQAPQQSTFAILVTLHQGYSIKNPINICYGVVARLLCEVLAQLWVNRPPRISGGGTGPRIRSEGY